MAAEVESTGTRRAVVLSERYMEWHRELNSSRAIHGGRRRHEDSDLDPSGFKRNFLKSEEFLAKPHPEEEPEEREAGGEEPVAEAVVGDKNGASLRIKRKKQLPQRQRSEVKKFRKENEIDQKRTAHMPSKEKSPPPVEGDGARMRRCKQPTSQSLQASHSKRQLQPLIAAQPQQPQSCLSQPIIKRKQRQITTSTSPPKGDKDLDERVLRSLTRTRGCETPPPAPAVPAGKGTKRSKRVALRLANEEPPPPPLKLPKLQLVLTRKEIQEDWLKITGQKYTGKPKKSTIVQRGLGLCTALTCPSSIRYLNEPQ